ncbi:MAG: hypothetical protein HDR80_10965 [Bacteroides sp.]|nr:hypothetical protein [Bacteroides sp.]
MFSLLESTKFTGKYIATPVTGITAGVFALPFLAPGTIGGNLIGTVAGGSAVSEVANSVYKYITGS